MSEQKNKMNPFLKVLIIAGSVVAGAFLVLNILWLVFFMQHIKPYRDKLGNTEGQGWFYVDEDKYTFGISYYYLRFESELQVGEVMRDDDSTYSNLNITVKPNGFEYRAGVSYRDPSDDPSKDYTSSFQLNHDIQQVDTEGNVIENLSETEKAEYDKALPELKIMFEKADKMWSGLN